MSHAMDDLKQEITKSREILLQLRDEIRVKVHLAGMDIKDAWATLNADADRVSQETSVAARDALHGLIEQFKALKLRLDA